MTGPVAMPVRNNHIDIPKHMYDNPNDIYNQPSLYVGEIRKKSLELSDSLKRDLHECSLRFEVGILFVK